MTDDELRAARGVANGLRYSIYLWVLIAVFVAWSVS